MVRVEEPEPLIEAGLKPPLVTPGGKGDSLSTVRVTDPAKPVMGVTVTVNVVDWPGVTDLRGRARGDREIGGRRSHRDRARRRTGIGVSVRVDHGQRGGVGARDVEGDASRGLRGGGRRRTSGKDPRVHAPPWCPC